MTIKKLNIQFEKLFESVLVDTDDAIQVFTPGTMEYNKLEQASEILSEELNIDVSIKTTYFNYGQRWQWTTLIGTDTQGKLVAGDSWQLINPNQQFELLYGNFNKAVQDIISSAVSSIIVL